MLSTARLTGQTIGGVTVALLAGAAFSGVAYGVSFLRMT